jgi:hypothetical protein
MFVFRKAVCFMFLLQLQSQFSQALFTILFRSQAFCFFRHFFTDVRWVALKLFYICVKTNKCTNYSFSLLVICDSFYMFQHYIVILRERSYSLLKNAELRCSRYHIVGILLTAPQLSLSQKALGTFPEGDNVIPKHVGATIYN